MPYHAFCFSNGMLALDGCSTTYHQAASQQLCWLSYKTAARISHYNIYKPNASNKCLNCLFRSSSLSLSQSLSIKLSIPLSLRPFPPIRPSPESELCPGKSHGMAKLANGRGLMDKCSAMSPCKPLRLTKSDDVQCPESKGSNMIQCITSMFGNGLCSCKRPWPFIDSSASHPATAHGLRQPSPKRNKVAPKHQEPIPLVCLATGLHLACVHCTNLPHNLH